MKSLNEVCLDEGFGPERLRHIEEALIEDRRTAMPWYLRIIVAIGAWLASIFFLGFAVVLIGDQEDHRAAIGCVGVVLLVIAVIAGRRKWGLFAGQCALAVSLAAQAMIYYGFLNVHSHTLAMLAAFSVGLAILLYFGYPNFLSRLMTCFVSLQFILFWIYAGHGDDPFSASRPVELLLPLVFFYGLFQLVAICWCFLKPRSWVLFAPLGYALVAALVAWQLENLFNLWGHWTGIDAGEVWMLVALFRSRTILVALTLFGVSVWAAGGISVLRDKAPLFAGLGLALAALVWMGSGGLLLSLLLMLLGFSLQNRGILGLGLILFPIFLSVYYYSLHLDLLAKSVVLIGSGLLMLLLRTGLARWVFVNPKGAS